MANQRRTFSEEFKQEAVALVVEHGYSYAAAGRSFIPNGPLSPTPSALFPTGSNTSNVLTGSEIGVSVSPDHDSCSGTINQVWTITVTID